MALNENRKRRVEIYRETRKITIIKTGGHAPTLFCDRCQRVVSIFSIEQTAAMLDADLNEICRLIGADVFHLVSAEKGVALVCADLLKKNDSQNLLREKL